MKWSGVIAALALVAWGDPVLGQALDQRFQNLARQTAVGVGGFTGAVRPLKGPVTLAYGPSAPRTQQFATLISTGGALVRISVRADLSRHATAVGMLMSATTLRDLTVEYLIAADGVTITHEALPNGTSVLVSTDRRGAIRDALILPPVADPAASVPQPGSRGFLEAVNRFPLPVLVRENAVQDTDIFLPVTFPLGAVAGFELVRGAGPRLRGEVDCKIGTCLLVEVDEETLFTGKDRSVRGSAVGHMLIGVDPVHVVSVFLNLRSEIRSQGRTQIIRSILVNKTID